MDRDLDLGEIEGPLRLHRASSSSSTFSCHVNPNLYTSSIVCLSLLDTYDNSGEGDERWTPPPFFRCSYPSMASSSPFEQPYYSASSYGHHLGNPGGTRNVPPMLRAPACSCSGPCRTYSATCRQGSRSSSPTISTATEGSSSVTASPTMLSSQVSVTPDPC